jgi:hypothetical protein
MRTCAEIRQGTIGWAIRAFRNQVQVRNSLAHMLRNRFYIGQAVFKGEILAGEQPAIINRTLFDEVQAKLTEQLNNHATTRMKSEALLVGGSSTTEAIA